MSRKVWQRVMVVALAMIPGCSSYEEILRAEYISMTTTEPPKHLDLGQKINVKWCTLDDVQSPGIGDGEGGLIDQVVMKANRKYDVAYILKPELVFERRTLFLPNCIHLKGYLPKKGS